MSRDLDRELGPSPGERSAERAREKQRNLRRPAFRKGSPAMPTSLPAHSRAMTRLRPPRLNLDKAAPRREEVSSCHGHSSDKASLIQIGIEAVVSPDSFHDVAIDWHISPARSSVRFASCLSAGLPARNPCVPSRIRRCASFTNAANRSYYPGPYRS